MRYFVHAPLLFWFCYDDHLASLLGVDAVGHVPMVAWAMMLLFLLLAELILFGLQRLLDWARLTFRRLPVRRALREPAQEGKVRDLRPAPAKETRTPTVSSAREQSMSQQVMEVLLTLGIKKDRAERALHRAVADVGYTSTVEDLTKATLKHCAR